MADYQLTATDVVIRTRDGASIPNDPANRDRAGFEAWLVAGNKPDAADPVRPVTTIDGIAFLSRLTPQEYQGIIVAARDNPQLGLWIEMLRMRGEIDVTGKTALEAKTGVVAMKLLTQERADQIFAAT